MKYLLTDGCAAQDRNSDTRLEVMRPPSCSTTSGRTAGQTSSLSSSTWSKCCISPADLGACPILRPAIHSAALKAKLSTNSQPSAGSRASFAHVNVLSSGSQDQSSCLHYGTWSILREACTSGWHLPERTSATSGHPRASAIFRAAAASSAQVICPTTIRPSPGRGHAAHKGACGACAAGQNGPRKAPRHGRCMGLSDPSQRSRPCKPWILLRPVASVKAYVKALSTSHQADSLLVYSSTPAACAALSHAWHDAAIHPRDDTWTTEGLGRYLKHFRGPWLPDGAQGLPQLHVEVHGARLRRGGVPVGDVDGGESHARRGSCAWRLHVKRPARVAAKDLHLGRHASSQSPLEQSQQGDVCF